MQNQKFSLPETGFLRLPAVLQIFPVGKSTWWQGVKDGRFPKAVKLGRRTTAWKKEDIQALIDGISSQSQTSKNHKIVD